MGKPGRLPDSFDLEAFLVRNGDELIANARRHSANAADADDAYQRALEMLLTRPPAIEEEGALVAWLHTVVRNEAMQQHRRKRHEVDAAFDEISSTWVAESPQPDESLVEAELYGQGREALRRIRPDQARCMLLRADGHGYPEICRITGFSYAKVNRLLSEGRRAFRTRVGMIESGAECSRLFPTLSMIADGEETPELRADADLHLDNCLACQSTLREMRALPDTLAALFPIGAAVTADRRGSLAQIGDHVRSLVDTVQEKLFGHAAGASQGAEVVTAKKIAAVTAVIAALTGGGVAVHNATQSDGRGASADPGATAPAVIRSESLIDPIRANRSGESGRARAAARAARTPDAADAAQLKSPKTAAEAQTGAAPALDPAQQVAPDPADSAPAGAGGGGDVGNLAP